MTGYSHINADGAVHNVVLDDDFRIEVDGKILSEDDFLKEHPDCRKKLYEIKALYKEFKRKETK